MRWLLTMALLALGLSYIAVFTVFKMNSADFVVRQHNERALVYGDQHVIGALPARLSFSASGNGVGYLGGGWYLPETEGVWSAMPDAWIEIGLLPIDDALTLRVDCSAFVNEAHPRISISADINGVPVGAWARAPSNGSEPLTMHLQRHTAASGKLTVHLRVEHAASPFHLLMGNDIRRLGIMLRSIEISSAGF